MGDKHSESDGRAPFVMPLLVAAVLVAVIVPFQMIVPRMEASWANQGVRVPTWVMTAISASHVISGYWPGLLAGLLLWVCWPRSPNRR